MIHRCMFLDNALLLNFYNVLLRLYYLFANHQTASLSPNLFQMEKLCLAKCWGL